MTPIDIRELNTVTKVARVAESKLTNPDHASAFRSTLTPSKVGTIVRPFPRFERFTYLKKGIAATIDNKAHDAIPTYFLRCMDY